MTNGFKNLTFATMYIIDQLNVICATLGSTTTHMYNIEAINEWCTLAGGIGGHRYDINGYNELDVIYGGSGGHKYTIDALNSISTALGGVGGWVYNIDALVSIGSNVNQNLPPLAVIEVTVPVEGFYVEMWFDDPGCMFPDYDSVVWNDDYGAFLESLGDFEVDWGDGTVETVNYLNNGLNIGLIHEYTEGVYQLKWNSPYIYLIAMADIVTDVLTLNSIINLNLSGLSLIENAVMTGIKTLQSINCESCVNLTNIGTLSINPKLKEINLNFSIVPQNQLNQLLDILKSDNFIELLNVYIKTTDISPNKTYVDAFVSAHPEVNLNYTYPSIIVNTESNIALNLAHGTCQYNDKFYLGTRENPANLYCFNNPTDLTDNQSVVTTGRNQLESMVYDSINNKIYATSNNADGNLCLLSIDPANISDWSIVYNSGVLDGGASPAIVTDGIYVYGVTNTNPGKIFKIRISDWTLVNSVVVTGYYSFHAAKLQTYSNRTEIYATTAELDSSEAHFIKILAEDLSFEIITLANCKTATDDFVFIKENDFGGKCYICFESTLNITVINTELMTYDTYTHKLGYSFGVFSDGINLYNLISDSGSGKIIKYINFNLINPIVNVVDIQLSELFISSTGKLFGTKWDTSFTNHPLIEFQMNET